MMKNFGNYLLAMLATLLGVAGLVGTGAAIVMLLGRIDGNNSFSVVRTLALLAASLALMGVGCFFDSLRATSTDSKQETMKVNDTQIGIFMGFLLVLAVLIFSYSSLLQEVTHLESEVNALHWKSSMILSDIKQWELQQ